MNAYVCYFYLLLMIFEELTELWEASVRATHHFIPEQYILKLNLGVECLSS